MATRADRLNERLRGAQRTNVDDEDTFGLDLDLGIPGISIPPPATAPEPTTAAPEPSSARKRKLSETASQPQPTRRSASRSVERSVPPRARQSSNVPSIPEEPEPAGATREKLPVRLSNGAQASPSRKRGSVVTREEALRVLNEPDAAAAAAAAAETQRTSPEAAEEEIEESPTNAPGSGKRRRVISTDVASASSARLRNAMDGESSPAPMSSPSAQRARRSTAARSMLGAVEETVEQDEEPTPVARVLRSASRSVSRASSQQAEETPVSAKKGRGRPPRKSVSTASPELGSPTKAREGRQQPETEETPARKPTPKRKGRPVKPTEPSPPTRRQPGRSAASKSPAPPSEVAEEEAEEEEEQEQQEEQPPSVAKPKGRPPKSPAAQRQPVNRRRSPRISRSPNETVKSRQPKAKAKKAAPKPQPRRRSSNISNTSHTPEGDDDDENDDAAIEITVQRYINQTSPSSDPLSDPLPFSSRSATTTVDVLAQICGEVISHTLDQLLSLLSRTDDPKKKKEYRIKLRAIDAYKEELSGRLLQHAIYLDHWHGLRGRVRAAQREREGLRKEIGRLRGEREGVGLRMDGLRERHDVESEEVKYRLDASSMMHDIELAVERGREAPELTPKQQKEAELANLEFLVAQVSDQASSKSATGGLQKQLADFNAFLERAAVALEGKV